jgi:hypothetical protein
LFLNSRHETPPTPIACDLHMFRLMIRFTSCLRIDKASRWGPSPNVGMGTQLFPNPRPHFLGMPPPPLGFNLHVSKVGRQFLTTIGRQGDLQSFTFSHWKRSSYIKFKSRFSYWIMLWVRPNALKQANITQSKKEMFLLTKCSTFWIQILPNKFH